MYAIEFKRGHDLKKKDTIIRVQKRGIPAIMRELEEMRKRRGYIYIIDKLPENWKEMDYFEMHVYCGDNYIYAIYDDSIRGRW